jgi:hypothetical protein
MSRWKLLLAVAIAAAVLLAFHALKPTPPVEQPPEHVPAEQPAQPPVEQPVEEAAEEQPEEQPRVEQPPSLIVAAIEAGEGRPGPR